VGRLETYLLCHQKRLKGYQQQQEVTLRILMNATVSCIPYEDEEQDSDMVPEADMVDAGGKPINQQYVVNMLVNAEWLLSLM